MVLYKAVLELGKQGRYPKLVAPSLEQILIVAHRWLGGKVDIRPEDLLSENVSIRLGSNTSVNAFYDEEGKEQFLGFELKHPDSENPLHGWLTIFATKVTPDRSTAQITLDKIDAASGKPIQNSIISRPKLVPMLINEFGAFEPNMDILTYPMQIPPSQAELFAGFLNDPLRKLPVVYASRTNRDGRLLVDPNKTADIVCGIAHVVYPENLRASNEIERFMPTKDRKCYDGAVRIYWPGVSGQMFNKYFTPEQLRNSGFFRRYNFNQTVLSVISEFLTKGPDVVTIKDIKDVKTRKTQSYLNEARDYGALAESYADENTSLRQNVLRLETLSSTLDQRCRLLQEALDDRANLAPERSNDSLEIANVYDAVQVVQKVFSDRVVFLSRAVNDARKSEYDDANAVFQALKVLATTYLDARRGIASVRDMNGLFMQNCGFKYAGGQHEKTMMAYREEYYATIEDGRKITLEEHLKGGIGRDPRNNIRIAFHYDTLTKKVYIGYFGTHQTNTKS
ncbi:MAG: hypothetical protein AABX32_00865 [Nanoarchaeota archaeon]